MRYTIYQSGEKRPRWRWNLKADNNEIIASGQGYKNKGDCVHAIDLLKGTDTGTPVKIED